MASQEEATEDFVPIAEVAARTGLSADTLRFYERSGLPPPIARSAGGQRRYTRRDLERIDFLLRRGTPGWRWLRCAASRTCAAPVKPGDHAAWRCSWSTAARCAPTSVTCARTCTPSTSRSTDTDASCVPKECPP